MYDSISKHRRLREQKMKQGRRDPGMMYPGGSPFFDEKTGQYAPGYDPRPQPGMMYTGGTPFFNEQTGQYAPGIQNDVARPTPEIKRRDYGRMAPRTSVSPAEVFQQYTQQNDNIGLEQLLQLLARYRMRGGF